MTAQGGPGLYQTGRGTLIQSSVHSLQLMFTECLGLGAGAGGGPGEGTGFLSLWGFPACGGERHVNTVTRCDKSSTRGTINIVPKCLGELRSVLSGHRVPVQQTMKLAKGKYTNP